MARTQWKLCATVRDFCFCMFLCVCGHICALALTFTDSFSTLFSLSLSLCVFQVFWGTCINALIHSVILFWFPLKMLEHGK